MLYPVESNRDEKQETPAKSDLEERQGTRNDPSTQGHISQSAAIGTGKKQVCLNIIPIKVFKKDNGLEEITYAIRDKGSNTTLVKKSLVVKLKLTGNPSNLQLTTMNEVSQESGKSHFLYVEGLGQRDCVEIPSGLSVKDLLVASQVKKILPSGAILHPCH